MSHLSSLLPLIAVATLLGACSSPDTSKSATMDPPSSDKQDQAGIGTNLAPDTSAGKADTGEPAGAKTEGTSKDAVSSLPANSEVPSPAPQESPAVEEPSEVGEPKEEPAEAGSGQPGTTSSSESPDPDPAAPEDSLSRTVVVPAGDVRVKPTKDGLTYIGVDRCAKCHKVQHTSWLETEHAGLTPPLDCEGCHGPGSEYKSLSIMKNAEASRAAGLVIPSREFCARCHIAGWEDDMLSRTHDHKPSTEE